MTHIDAQIEWLTKQLKSFVLSHYAGRLSVDFKQGSLLQTEMEPSLPDLPVAASAGELKIFSEQASPGDALTFIRRDNGNLARRKKTILKVPRHAK